MADPRDTKPSSDVPGPVTGDLAARIAKAKQNTLTQAAKIEAARAKDMSGLARGLRIGTEFIAAILVGAGLGFVLDQIAGTAPWGMLALLLLGFAAGILNVIRTVAEMNAASPAPPGSDLGPEADDDEDER